MYHHERALRQSFNTHQSEVLNTIADYRFLAPARLAAQERLAADLAYHAAMCGGGPGNPSQPGAVRRRFGASIVRLGRWIGGIATSPSPTPLTPNVVAIEERAVG